MQKVIRFRVVWVEYSIRVEKGRVEIHNWSRTYGEYREPRMRKNSQQRQCPIVTWCVCGVIGSERSSENEKSHLASIFPSFPRWIRYLGP